MKFLFATLALCALSARAETLTDAPRLRPALLKSRQAVGTPAIATAEGRQPQPPATRELRGGSGMNVPRELQLVIGAAGIFFSFSIFAEDVYKKAYGGEYFAFTFLALVIERGVNALTAYLGNLALGPSGQTAVEMPDPVPLHCKRRPRRLRTRARLDGSHPRCPLDHTHNIPHKEIFNSGISQMLAMAASNEALRYVSFPTQVLGKSCKMVPVALITLGVSVFNFGGKKKKVGKPDQPFGLLLLGASLLMDAVTGGLQDKVKKTTKEINPLVKGAKPSMHESMLWTNASGCLVALLLALLTGQPGHLVNGLAFCSKHPEAPPSAVLKAIVVYSISSAVGQNFVYYTLTQFNPLVLTTVTTTRKIFSTLFSVFRNPENSLSPMQWGGTSLVFAGLIGDIAKKMMS
ncbi:hypothetical protein EMIHUDRAFT_103684 [Emiliania huxleyi CCMP1516]|uniref:Uncharacterized protein n=2 Tax=Emiliania huxleyi TaxID=2903 RepID=A0A0D3IRF2_EMIH1|nr:hypothetical protein EMIHUDRAFT_103684 [Emiliania huxleyi CCMP1516]EOD13837.1 hypothetical protein EMIHUDRAFT_103684 [Emiliania huxleyi CCMP1516]|eukprot:XP_005766266.1 hypothetical protein EMIHUDRAFT_103684 [Emiliania huxleyi CCMP1516]